MKKLRLLLDCQILQSKSRKRGFGSYGYRILNELIEGEQFDIELLMTRNGKYNHTKELIEFAKSHKIPFHSFPHPVVDPVSNNPKAIARSNENFVSVVNCINPDLLFVLAPMALPHEQISCLNGLNNSIKSFCLYFDSISIEDINTKNPNSRELELIRKHTEIKNYDLIICISETVRDELTQYYENLNVVVHGLKINFRGLNRNNSGVLSIVSTQHHKNLSGLIHEFREYSKNYSSNRRLSIVGVSRIHQFKYRDELRIDFFHRIPESLLMKLYRQSQFVIIPSFREGLGMPVIEALEFGSIPLCSSLVPSAGILNNRLFEFNPYEAGSLSSKLIEIDDLITSDFEKIEETILQGVDIHNSHFVNISKQILESVYD